MGIAHVQFLDKPWEDCEHQGYKGPGWYFWDETDIYCHGPYVAEIIASKALDEYAYHLERENIQQGRMLTNLDFTATELVTMVAPVDRAHAHYDRSE